MCQDRLFLVLLGSRTRTTRSKDKDKDLKSEDEDTDFRFKDKDNEVQGQGQGLEVRGQGQGLVIGPRGYSRTRTFLEDNNTAKIWGYETRSLITQYVASSRQCGRYAERVEWHVVG